jgi:serine/threonine protein kinase
LLSVLAVIQKKYPGFRHNDLKANNVLIQKIDMRNKNNKFKYKINDKDYIVPNIGIQIKIWDFDFACIPGIVENAKVNTSWCKKINIVPERNRYYDVHYFFNTLTKKGFLPQFYDSDEIPQKVKEFVKRVVPEEYSDGKYVANRGRILINKELTTPDLLLKTDPFFEKMRPKK